MSGAVLGWLALSSVAATALVGLVLLARGPARRAFGARAAMLLWAAPGLRLVLPPLGFGVVGLGTWAGPGGGAAGAGASGPVAAPPSPPTTRLPDVMGVPLPPVPEAASSLPALPSWPGLVLAVWLVGAVVAGAASLLATARWRRTLLAEQAGPTPPALDAAMTRAAREAGYGGHVRLIVSGAAASPQVLGPRRPLVAVPTDFAETYTQDQQRLALLHEATHLARGDLWVLALAEALCAVHWFNPPLRAALPRLRADQEAACDEAVRVGGARASDYAGTLLRAARGPLVPALTLNHDLSRRIETMRDPLPRRATTMLGASVIAAAAVLLAGATQAQTGERTGTPDAPEPRGADAYTYDYTYTEDGIVLLGDPFAAIPEPMPAPPPMADAPSIPPVPPGDSFEDQMEAWGESMEAWGDAFGEAWDGYGEQMGDWGERMGAVGEAIGTLAEDCADHRERTDAPVILRAEAEGQAIRAVCARGGRDRYASAELAAFVADARDLSAAERASYAERVADMRQGARADRIERIVLVDRDASDTDRPADAGTAPFTRIEASSGTSVVVRPGRAHAVALDARAQERTTYAVEDGVLRVACKRRRSSCPRGDRGEVTVTMPSLSALSASSGAAISVGRNIEVAGTLDLAASSGGAIDAGDLRAGDVTAKASSGGAVTLTATDTLDAAASSGGAISHRGGAEVTARQSSGGSVSGR